MGEPGERRQEVWYNDDSGVVQRILVSPDTDWAWALLHYPGARVAFLVRDEHGVLQVEEITNG